MIGDRRPQHGAPVECDWCDELATVLIDDGIAGVPWTDRACPEHAKTWAQGRDMRMIGEAS